MVSKKGRVLYITILGLVILFCFFPSPSANIEVRKHILLTGHPLLAVTTELKNQGKRGSEGYLFYASDLSSSYIYVKQTRLGWIVDKSGTGP